MVYALGVRLNTDISKPSIVKTNADLTTKKFSYEISDDNSGINWSTLSVEVDGEFYEYERDNNLIEISFLSDDNSIHVINLWVQDNYGNSRSYNETIDFNTLSTLEEEIAIVQFYPNPIKNELTLNSKEIINEIEVYNSIGVLVFRQKVNSVKSKISLADLIKGVYILKIKTNKSFKSYSIIKK